MSRMLILFAALLIAIVAFLMLRDHPTETVTTPSVTTPASGNVKSEDAKESQIASNFKDWRQFSFKSGHFKISLPSLPQHVTDSVADPKTQESRKYETFATAGVNGSAFIVNAITYSTPRDAEASEDTLKALITEMLERNKENKLKEMKKGTFKGMPDLDFSLTNADVLIMGKVFAHENTMYILSMLNKNDTFDLKEYDYFVNSFDFFEDKGPQKNTVPTNTIPANTVPAKKTAVE